MSDYAKDIEAAMDMVRALCTPRGSKGAREWVMSIPARPNYDPDLVIAQGFRAAKECIATLEAQVAAREEAIRGAIDYLDRVRPAYLARAALQRLRDALGDTKAPTHNPAHKTGADSAIQSALEEPVQRELPQPEDIFGSWKRLDEEERGK